MIGKHCGQTLTTIEDSCIKMVKQCRICSDKFTQTKRRPKDALLDECTWHALVICPAHPDSGGTLIP